MLDTMTADWDFPVETQPIFDLHGEVIPGHKSIMRTDTNQVLGVHGSRYQMVSHGNIIEAMMDSIKSANISRDYQEKIIVLDGGRKMRGEILFPDLTVQPQVGDYVQFRVSFFNSYDGSWSVQANAEGLRLWCLNGCTTPDVASRNKFKHTNNINIDGTAAKITNGLEGFLGSEQRWRDWMRIQVSDEMAETFFKHTLAKSFTRQTQMKTNEKQLENLLGIWANEKRNLGGNKWALYNCMTYWATHTNDLKQPEIARRNREDQIARAMTNRKFMELA